MVVLVIWQSLLFRAGLAWYKSMIYINDIYWIYIRFFRVRKKSDIYPIFSTAKKIRQLDFFNCENPLKSYFFKSTFINLNLLQLNQWQSFNSDCIDTCKIKSCYYCHITCKYTCKYTKTVKESCHFYSTETYKR